MIVIRDQTGRELRSCSPTVRNCATDAENAQLGTQLANPETAPKAAPNEEVACATPRATGAQLAVARHAYSAQLSATDTQLENWLLHFADREPIKVYFAAAQTHEQLLTEWYPDAVAARASADPMTRKPWAKAADAPKRLSGRHGVKRRKRLLAANPLCTHCMQIGRIVLATVLDHIIPLSRNGPDTDSNLRGLCKPCHDRVTREQRGFKPKVRIGLDGYPCDK